MSRYNGTRLGATCMPLVVSNTVSAEQMVGIHKVALSKTDTVIQFTFRQVACPVVDI